MAPQELESLLKGPGVLAGVFLTILVLDKLSFWLLKIVAVMRPKDDQTSAVLAKLASAVEQLAENGRNQERLLERVHDRLELVEHTLRRMDEVR